MDNMHIERVTSLVLTKHSTIWANSLFAIHVHKIYLFPLSIAHHNAGCCVYNVYMAAMSLDILMKKTD